jgi:uroporphyrinogen decarboxylase
MNDRERLIACALGEPLDRPPYWLLWGPWGTTWARWQKEGKPESVKDFRSFMDPDQPPLAVPVNCGPCPRIESVVLAEDEETVTFLDGWGIKRKNFKHSESMSQFLEFPVKSRRDWEQFKEERLDPDHPDRLAGDWLVQGREWMRRGWPIQLGYFPDVGLFGTVRWLLGDEECLLAFYTQPELVHEIMDHMTSLYLTVYEKVARELRIDMVFFWEDMCGRNGPLISPRLFDEFMAPHYRRVKDFARRHDIPLMGVDTDGQVDLIVPPMMRAGVNFLFPFEVAAGCDVNEFGLRYPELAMMGGIDKRALALGPGAIDRELERIRPAVERGRFIPDLDHLVPDDVSWENYCYYVAQLKRLAGKP